MTTVIVHGNTGRVGGGREGRGGGAGGGGGGVRGRGGWVCFQETVMRAPPRGESPTCQRPPVERTIESPMARPRPALGPASGAAPGAGLGLRLGGGGVGGGGGGGGGVGLAPGPGPGRCSVTRWKRSNRRERSASGMPGPLSSTVRLTRLPWVRTPIRTCPAGAAERHGVATRAP